MLGVVISRLSNRVARSRLGSIPTRLQMIIVTVDGVASLATTAAQNLLSAALMACGTPSPAELDL